MKLRSMLYAPPTADPPKMALSGLHMLPPNCADPPGHAAIPKKVGGGALGSS